MASFIVAFYIPPFRYHKSSPVVKDYALKARGYRFTPQTKHFEFCNDFYND